MGTVKRMRISQRMSQHIMQLKLARRISNPPTRLKSYQIDMFISRLLLLVKSENDILMKNTVLRVIIWKQWKVPKKREWGLKKLGVKPWQAHMLSYLKGYMKTVRLDVNKPIDFLCKKDLQKMIADMRDTNLSSNTIRSYTATLKTFFTWCREEGIADLDIPLYKAEETIKETYTDHELEILLKKPYTRTCKFSEYLNDGRLEISNVGCCKVLSGSR